MSEKRKITISLGEENVEWIDEKYHNRSGFLDDLVTKYREGTGHADDVVRDLRIQQLEAEAEDLVSEGELKQKRAEEKREQAERLRNQSSLEQEEQNRILEDAVDKLAGLPSDPSGEHIKTWAEKADMTPEAFAEALEEKRSDQ